MKIPKEVLDFAKEKGLTNIEPHPFWYKQKYKGYEVYTCDTEKDSNICEWILVNKDEVRTPTQKEFEDMYFVFV